MRLAVTAQMFTETINTVLVKNTAFPSFLDILKETRGLKILDIFFMKSCRSLCLRTSSSIRNQDATGCTVHGSDSGGSEIFCTAQTDLDAYTVSCTKSTESLSRA